MINNRTIADRISLDAAPISETRVVNVPRYAVTVPAFASEMKETKVTVVANAPVS